MCFWRFLRKVSKTIENLQRVHGSPREWIGGRRPEVELSFCWQARRKSTILCQNSRSGAVLLVQALIFMHRRGGFALCAQARWFCKTVQNHRACARKSLVCKIVKNLWENAKFQQESAHSSRGLAVIFPRPSSHPSSRPSSLPPPSNNIPHDHGPRNLERPGGMCGAPE